ncbi:hypothetical protein C8F04DRAFT_977979 [Mycena alexandri]|uniref:BTB domain-containing protein n=2 Tax=Mycena alexandri TaxID=1745969 RepID=A0AAD6S054_9AGAR|nr:hypothetical protein C8F04DRAFT_977979 [Mycena alexandri]
MFQVASHPAGFPHAHPAAAPSARRYRPDESAVPGPIQMPRKLERPPFTDISRDTLTAAAPELAAVPAEFIRQGLRTKAPQMQAGIAALAPSHLPPSIPRSHLPQALTVPLRAPPPGAPSPLSYPTHALAIGAQSSKGSKDSAPQLVFAVHAVVLAAHCANIPRFPAPPRSRASASVTLPILPLSLPSPQAFAILHAFMYTHRIDAALGALLPFPPTFLETLAPSSSTAAHLAAALASGSTRHQLNAHLCAASSGNLSTLMTHAAHVRELWQDMVALGLYDPTLWDALDLAWEVVLGAMNLAAH